MMAAAPDKDRAVVTSSRNFFRTMGGAFGLAIANAVFNNTVSSTLPKVLDAEQRNNILHSSISYAKTLSPELQLGIIESYASGLKMCYILFAAGSGVCFLLSFFIKVICDPHISRSTGRTADNVYRRSSSGKIQRGSESEKSSKRRMQ